MDFTSMMDEESVLQYRGVVMQILFYVSLCREPEMYHGSVLFF